MLIKIGPTMILMKSSWYQIIQVKKNWRGEAISKDQSVCYTWDVVDRKRKSVIKMKGYLFIFSRILSKKP